jgi:hypothetical protein
MHNMPDDIGNYTCPHCKEITPCCICDDLDEEAFCKLHDDILSGDREDLYYEMFDSMDSDVVLGLLRALQSHNTPENVNNLVGQLDGMLSNLIKKELEE